MASRLSVLIEVAQATTRVVGSPGSKHSCAPWETAVHFSLLHNFNFCAEIVEATDDVFVTAVDTVNVAQNRCTFGGEHAD